jgi:hypothetical protein
LRLQDDFLGVQAVAHQGDDRQTGGEEGQRDANAALHGWVRVFGRIQEFV